MHRYKLAPRGRQTARGRREGTGAKLIVMAWGWNVDEEYRVHEGLPRKGGHMLQQAAVKVKIVISAPPVLKSSSSSSSASL